MRTSTIAMGMAAVAVTVLGGAVTAGLALRSTEIWALVEAAVAPAGEDDDWPDCDECRRQGHCASCLCDNGG